MKFILKNDLRTVGTLSIGTLNEEAELLYDDEWINDPNGFSILPELQKNQITHQGAKVRNFFENLLPESKRRDLFAKTHQLELSDIPNFLKEFGKDTSGAIQVYEESYDFSSIDLNSKRNITRNELIRILDNSNEPTSALEKKLDLRFSMAGAQEKFTTVLEEDGSFSFPDKGGSSTHIIKPSSRNTADLGKDILLTPLNEHILMSIAREIWPETPRTQVIHGEKYDYFVIERFDRIVNSDKSITRLHQYDICQLMGVASTIKYEHQGGPGIVNIIEQIKINSNDPVKDLKKFQNWILFNLFFGNNDCHAKNFSFICKTKGEIEVSPFYDLLSTNFYSKRTAQIFSLYFPYSINHGTSRDMMNIKSLRWLAQQLKIRENDFIESSIAFNRKIIIAMNTVRARFEAEYKGTEKLKSINKIFNHLEKTSSQMTTFLYLRNSDLMTNVICKKCGQKLKTKKEMVLGIHENCFKNIDL